MYNGMQYSKRWSSGGVSSNKQERMNPYPDTRTTGPHSQKHTYVPAMLRLYFIFIYFIRKLFGFNG